MGGRGGAAATVVAQKCTEYETNFSTCIISLKKIKSRISHLQLICVYQEISQANLIMVLGRDVSWPLLFFFFVAVNLTKWAIRLGHIALKQFECLEIERVKMKILRDRIASWDWTHLAESQLEFDFHWAKHQSQWPRTGIPTPHKADKSTNAHPKECFLQFRTQCWLCEPLVGWGGLQSVFPCNS